MNSRTLDIKLVFREITRQRKKTIRLRGFHFFALILVLSLSSLSLPVIAADQSTTRGAALANACATCHGPDGRSQGAIPAINSLSKESLLTAMRAFQSGERQGTVMNRIAKGLDDADIEAVAVYFMNLEKR
ncbi:MAG: cytochrome c [Candidatus Binatia bacterium]